MRDKRFNKKFANLKKDMLEMHRKIMKQADGNDFELIGNAVKLGVVDMSLQSVQANGNFTVAQRDQFDELMEINLNEIGHISDLLDDSPKPTEKRNES